MELKAPWLKFYGKVKKSLDYPEITLWESLYRVVCKYPQYTALIYMNRKITYKEMAERIEAVQSGLESIGVKKGDKVTVCLPNTLQAVYLLYALNRMGAVACFVHPLSAPKELEEYIKVSGSDFVVMLREQGAKVKALKDKFKEIKIILTSPTDELNCIKSTAYRMPGRASDRYREKDVYCWHRLMHRKKASEVRAAKADPHCAAVVLFSGGTTGTQKGVLISSFGLNAMAMQTAAMSNCTVTGKTMLAAMPVFHGFGLGVCVHAVLIHGGCSILIPRFTVEGYGKFIKKYRPNFIAGVPTMFEAITRCENLRDTDLSCLTGVFSGGDALPWELKEKFDGYLKDHGATVKIREGYGLTECVTASCLTPYNTERKGSIGIPFPDTYYKICSVNSTEELPYGSEGEICITGPALMLGYIDNSEETRKVLKKHKDGHVWLHTGDLGMMDEDGFVYFRQRIKRMIVTSGYNVYPSQTEEILSTHPAVKSCCVVGVKDAYKMQRVKACVVLNEGFFATDMLKSELTSYCKAYTAQYAVPSCIEFLPCLPVTALGKTDYRRLEEETQCIGT